MTLEEQIVEAISPRFVSFGTARYIADVIVGLLRQGPTETMCVTHGGVMFKADPPTCNYWQDGPNRCDPAVYALALLEEEA